MLYTNTSESDLRWQMTRFKVIKANFEKFVNVKVISKILRIAYFSIWDKKKCSVCMLA